MFSGANGLSGSNKAKIHSNFKSNTNWTTDWSSHVRLQYFDSNLAAINLWFLPNKCHDLYGHISDWNVSAVTT